MFIYCLFSFYFQFLPYFFNESKQFLAPKSQRHTFFLLIQFASEEKVEERGVGGGEDEALKKNRKEKATLNAPSGPAVDVLSYTLPLQVIRALIDRVTNLRCRLHLVATSRAPGRPLLS